MDGQDQPKIYTIRDHTLEVLVHPDVLEVHAVRVIHTSQRDERQLHLKVHVRCGQEELVVDVLVDTDMMEWMCVKPGSKAVGSLLRRGVKPVRLPHDRLRHRPRNGQRRV